MEDVKRMVERGAYVAAIRHFQERRASGEVGASALGWGYHYVSVAQYQLREVFAAKDSGEQASRLGEAVGDMRLKLRAWANLVQFCQKLGDTVLALEYGDKWLSEVDKAPEEEPRRGQVLYNLALTHRSRRDMEESLRYLRLAYESAPEKQSEFRLLVLQMSGWILYTTGRMDDGDQIVQQAASIIAETPAPIHIIREQLLLHAWREYHMQNHTACLDLCREFLEGETTLHQRFWAAAMIAGCAIQLYPDNGTVLAQMKQAAFFYTDLCRQLAIESKESRLLNHYNRIRQQVKARWADFEAG